MRRKCKITPRKRQDRRVQKSKSKCLQDQVVSEGSWLDMKEQEIKAISRVQEILTYFFFFQNITKSQSKSKHELSFVCWPASVQILKAGCLEPNQLVSHPCYITSWFCNLSFFVYIRIAPASQDCCENYVSYHK